jgi:transcriptional regulator EpsA
LELIQKSLEPQSHFELFLWLQGRLQKLLPHEIMIAAWGDFSLGQINFDIISPLPGIRTKGVSQDNLTPLLKRLYGYWCSYNQAPFAINIEQGLFNIDELDCNIFNDSLSSMTSAVVHGIKDCRGHHDCLYVLMSSDSMPTSSRKMLKVFLPYIDNALRQIDHLAEQLPEENLFTTTLPGKITDNLLSARELEIMDWVKMGKTNMEIGMILNISAFTVKNHLQHIFRKLDVLNRAQAVSKC